MKRNIIKIQQYYTFFLNTRGLPLREGDINGDKSGKFLSDVKLANFISADQLISGRVDRASGT